MTPTGDRGTWHYGLVARYWAEFNEPEPDELAYYAAAIERFGQPALDLGCGTGRLLLPLVAAGLDIDGVDISADMLALCAERARGDELSLTLHAQAAHRLDLPRRYRTIYLCGTFGLGGRRDRDLEALRRIHRHLEPGGAVVFDQELPWFGRDAASWARWLPAHRDDNRRAWPETGERRRTADGDELELVARLDELDPIQARQTLEIRARLWRGDELLAEEFGTLSECLYSVPEVRLMLEVAGFTGVGVEVAFTGAPVTPGDGKVVFVARRP